MGLGSRLAIPGAMRLGGGVCRFGHCIHVDYSVVRVPFAVPVQALLWPSNYQSLPPQGLTKRQLRVELQKPSTHYADLPGVKRGHGCP